VRAEVLAGFVNGLFLLFIAFFIFSEAVEVSSSGDQVYSEGMLLYWPPFAINREYLP